jgi:hypothetical protein
VEPEGSLPHSQEPATCPYLLRLQYNPYLMNCWRNRIYFTKLRFSLNGGSIYVELLSGHEKSSLNPGTLNRGFTVCIVGKIQRKILNVVVSLGRKHTVIIDLTNECMW